MLQCALYAICSANYEKAQEMVFKAYGISVGDDTIRRVTGVIGKLIWEDELQQAERIISESGSDTKLFNHETEGTLYIEMDGAMYNTNIKAAGSSWKENKQGLVFSSDNTEPYLGADKKMHRRINKRDITCTTGNVDVFRKILYACAIQNGYGRYANTVILSDGASWIAKTARDWFPDAVRILDLAHLKENVNTKIDSLEKTNDNTVAKRKHNDREEDYKPWAEGIIERLEAGDWQSALSQLSPSEKYKDCVNLYQYILDISDSINYPEYAMRGFVVGSGAVESSHKQVLQSRMTLAGMRWDPQNAQHVLTLRARLISDRWQDVERYIQDYYKIPSQ